MNVLTIHCGNNSSAALAQKGHITGAASQERFDNIKNSNQFPDDAIDWLIQQAGISVDQIEVVGLCSSAATPETALALKKRGITGAKTRYLDHHTCHAFAPVSFFPEASRPWLIFTADAESDGISATVNIWDGRNMNRVAQSLPESSLGYLYGLTTSFMGMKMLEHEYKVMGLAAYARTEDFIDVYNNVFKDVVGFAPDDPLVFQSKTPLNEFNKYLGKKINSEIKPEALAGALQCCLEGIVLQWIKNAVKQTGITKVMTGGGVFMNVKLNKLIREMPEISETRFMPSCGDETSTLGAACILHKEKGLPFEPAGTLYLGHSYTNDEIEKFLNTHPGKNKFSFSHQSDIAGTVAGLLAEHKVVARFAGRSEFGARSLGNRAILAHPADINSFSTVNDQIKARDAWMPFAPTILDIDAPRYIHNPGNAEAPYMIDAFDSTVEGQAALCAAMHKSDRTVRPQILTREANPDYYRVIEAFKEKTGIGSVLNTSFNLHGYPLASTLEQAMFTMLHSGLCHMALGNWLVLKH